jgi:flavin reductase (DIM6/NTAB) family NADH-FMN oxidoreductase RutF
MIFSRLCAIIYFGRRILRLPILKNGGMTDHMKEKIELSEYAGQITKMLPKGILLNTQTDTFDTMVIGWGAVGTNWGLPCFTVYVRESRYTLEQLTKNPAFTISVPLTDTIPAVTRICGSKSGRDTDKVKEAGLTLENAEVNGVPGIREYPLTLECRVLYRQPQAENTYPADILAKYYPVEENGKRDLHTMFIGQIVDAYIIR